MPTPPNNPQDAFDSHLALQKVKALTEACARHGLPMVVLVGLPGHTNVGSECVRASVGMGHSAENRAFMIHKFAEYIMQFENGELKSNGRIKPDGS